MEEASRASGLNGLRIALVGDAVTQRRYLETALRAVGADVVLAGALDAGFLRELDRVTIEVVVLDLPAEAERGARFLEALLERNELPIVFNDVAALSLRPRHQARWFATLLEKLARLTEQGSVHTRPPVAARRAVAAQQVWVLGASLGGPQAVSRFLGALPASVPAAFVLAQHLGANVLGLLAEQLDRATTLRVTVPQPGHLLHAGEVVLAPIAQRLRLSTLGTLQLEPADTACAYRPCIDQLAEEVGLRYGPRAGAIVFSGMGNDGAKGCSLLAARGGTVWAQSAESCIISSMPDSVRAAGVVSFSGTPEALARRLIDHLQGQPARGES